jgi:hypothetical protein
VALPIASARAAVIAEAERLVGAVAR